MGKLLLVIKNSWLIFCLTLFIVLCSCTEVSFGFSTQRKFSCLCTDSQLKNYSIEKLPAIAECSISLKEYFYIGSIIYRELKQYEPIGQPISTPEQFPSENDKIKFEIQIDSTIYYQGKAINLLIKITNISDHPVKLTGLVPFSMYNISRAASIFPVNGVYYFSGNTVLEPGEDYYNSTDLLQWYSSYNNDWRDTTVFQHYYMGAGEYSFKAGMEFDIQQSGQHYLRLSEKATSNEIRFEIIALPDSLSDNFKMVKGTSRADAGKYISNLQNYAGSFFEYEYWSGLIASRYHQNYYTRNETEEGKQQRYQFILNFLRKYPDTGFAYDLSDRLMEMKAEYPELFEANKDWLLDKNTWIGLMLTNKPNRREK